MKYQHVTIYHTSIKDHGGKPPTKLYRGRRRVAKKWTNLDDTPLTEFIKYTIGDVIHTCDGFNRKIVDIRYEWVRLGRKTSVLDEIVFFDVNDRMHIVMGNKERHSCVSHRVDPDKIRAYWRRVWLEADETKDDGFGFTAYAKKLFEMGEFLNEDGEPLLEMTRELK